MFTKQQSQRKVGCSKPPSPLPIQPSTPWNLTREDLKLTFILTGPSEQAKTPPGNSLAQQQPQLVQIYLPALQQQNQQLLLLYRYSCTTLSKAAYTTSTESQVIQNTLG